MEIICLLLIIGMATACSSKATHKEITLSGKEKHYCDSLQLDTIIIGQLREFTSSAFEPFHYSLSKELHPDGTEKELDPIHLQGLVFKETANHTELILDKCYNSFKNKGYSIFTLERNYGIENTPDVMGILKTNDKYDILKQIKTDGINYDITTDSLVSIMKIFDKECALGLVGASGDWCEFTINKEPGNWLAFAKEVYKFCPDIVDQGTGTVEALASEMKKTKRLYLWWD